MKWQVLHFTSANDQLKDDAMNPYHHLTQEQRYLINAEMNTDKNLGQIALDLGCSRQTLWRERKRNKGLSGHRAEMDKMEVNGLCHREREQGIQFCFDNLVAFAGQSQVGVGILPILIATG